MLTKLSNPLERLDGEIKHLTDGLGISPDGAAVVRLLGALLPEQGASGPCNVAP